MKNIFLTVVLLILTSCATQHARFGKGSNLNDESYLKSGASDIKILQSIPSSNFENLGQVKTLRCNNDVFTANATNDDLINDLKIEAFKLGANYIFNLQSNKHLPVDALARNCWSAISASATAYKIIETNKLQNNKNIDEKSVKLNKNDEKKFIGIGIQEVTKETADALGFKNSAGVLVSSLTKNGPAHKAGIKPGDIILEVDNKEINNLYKLPEIIQETQIGQTIDIKIWRNSEIIISQITVQKPKEDSNNQITSLKKDDDKKNFSSNKNKNLVIFYIEKEVPNKNLLPKISSDNQKIVTLNSLDRNQLKKILTENENILIITPKSISLNKRNIEEKYFNSKYVLGTDRVVNDANQNLQRELQAMNSEISRLDAGRARAREAAASYGYCGGNMGCIAQQFAATAAAEQWASQLDDAVNQRNNIVRQLNSTPTYLDRKSYKNYSYKMTTIKNNKDVIFNLVEINNEKFFKNSIYLIDAAEFSIVSNVNSADESYREIVSGSKSLQDVDNWEKSRFRNVQLKELNNDANKIEIKSSETLESLELQKNIFKVLFSK